MSDISNFVQRGTDIMLGELTVSHVSHGPCTNLSLFAITQRLTDASDISFLAPLCAEGCWVCLPGEVVPGSPLAAGFSRQELPPCLHSVEQHVTGLVCATS